MPNPMDAMCWVSPADEKGNIDNLLTRVSKLEEIIAQLLGANINALQLADITPRVGVVTDMTAIASNAAGGWITDGTFTGVGISTLGWKMSDGNTYPIVQMMDGVLQYGFNNAGTIGGTQRTTDTGRASLIGIAIPWGSYPLPTSGLETITAIQTSSGTLIAPSTGNYLVAWTLNVDHTTSGSNSRYAFNLTVNDSAIRPIWSFDVAAGMPSADYNNSGAVAFPMNAGNSVGFNVIATGTGSVQPYLELISLG